MLLTALFSALLLQAAPLPPDSTTTTPPRRLSNGGGALLGTSIALVDHSPFRLSPGPVAGFYYFEHLSSRWSFQVEFHWKQANGYNLSAVFADTVLNPSGIGISRATFGVRTLVYWEVPIMLQWRPELGSRHAFAIGVRPSMNVLSRGQTGSSSQSSSGFVVTTDMSYLSARDGLRRSDVGFLVGWTYALTDRLGLDVRYTQGLQDLTADNFFKNKSNTLNSDLQATLRARF